MKLREKNNSIEKDLKRIKVRMRRTWMDKIPRIKLHGKIIERSLLFFEKK